MEQPPANPELDQANRAAQEMAYAAVSSDPKLYEQERDRVMEQFFANRRINAEQQEQMRAEINDEVRHATHRAEVNARTKAVLNKAMEIVEVDRNKATELRQGVEAILSLTDDDNPSRGPLGRNQQYREMVSRIEDTQFGKPNEVN